MIFDNCTSIKKLYNYLILILLKYITNKNLNISALRICMYTYIYVYISTIKCFIIRFNNRTEIIIITKSITPQKSYSC